jgi:hypothetical protein
MRYIYWLLLMATAVVAVLNFRIRCESFGCMGLGVAWFAWSGLYLVTLIAGLIALLKARDNQNKRPVTWPLMGQLAGGLALGIYWFIGVSGVS